jgi:hypothetical protein
VAKSVQDTDSHDELREAFKAFDRNGDDIIDAAELRLVMSKLGEQLTDAEIDEMIQTADRDGDVSKALKASRSSSCESVSCTDFATSAKKSGKSTSSSPTNDIICVTRLREYLDSNCVFYAPVTRNLDHIVLPFFVRLHIGYMFVR